MRGRERRLLERAASMLKFCTSPGLYPPLAQAPQSFHDEVSVLSEAVATATGFDNELRSARGNAKRSRLDSVAAQDDLRRHHLVPMHQLAKAIVRGSNNPGLPHLFRPPRSGGNRRGLLAAAHAAVRDAEPVAQTFVQNGAAPDFLDRFRDAITEVESRIDGIRTGRARRFTALQGITDALDRAQRVLIILDVILRRLCAADPINGPRTLAAWEGMSRAEPDPVRAPAASPAPAAGSLGNPPAARATATGGTS